MVELASTGSGSDPEIGVLAVQPGSETEYARRLCLAPTARVRISDVLTLERQLSQRVVERFSQACGAIATVVQVGLPALEQDQDVPPNPGHPLCAQEAGSDYCRESWQLHLADLMSDPKPHWHRCRHGRLCAVVPVVCRGRCVAATKLVCPPSESIERFEHLVGVLDALVRDHVAAEGSTLEELAGDDPSTDSHLVPFPVAPRFLEADPSHPLIPQAKRYIEENLSNPRLAVSQVADALGVSANHLSRLFSDCVGARLGRWIVEERVRKAKFLLVATELQVKQIAHDTGYANSSWFSHVFHSYTGFTPSEYRDRSQRSIA